MALLGTTVCGGLLFYGLFTLSHVIVLRSFDREQPTLRWCAAAVIGL